MLPLALMPSNRGPEDAMTIPRPRIDPSEIDHTQLGMGAGSSPRVQFALGTPTFVRPRTDRPSHPDDEVTFVGPNEDLRKSRPLPVAEPLVDFTIPMERMEGENEVEHE